jgi:formamidopyrimidine-DNA glycosylase
MPEVIEVKQYSNFIKKHINNKNLLNIKIKKGRYRTHGPFEFYKKIKNQLPLKILNVESKGKFMYMSLENNFYIGITLGLTGGWFYNNTSKMMHGLNTDKYEKKQVDVYMKNALNNINVEFIFENGILYFYDQLSFGTIKIFLNKEQVNKKLSLIGIDLMDLNTSFEMFREQINKSTNENKFIGNVLLNQKLVSGVGNYIRADSLWMSKISPFRKVKDISESELSKLFYNIRKLIWGNYNYNKALKLKVIKKSDKLPIKYGRDFLVYQNEKDIYNNDVTKEKLYEGSQIRYIYWVKNYQK